MKRDSLLLGERKGEESRLSGPARLFDYSRVVWHSIFLVFVVTTAEHLSAARTVEQN